MSQAKVPNWALASAAIGVAVCSELYRRRRNRPRGATFVPGHWFFGNLLEQVRAVARKQQNEYNLEQHRRYGRTLAFKFPFSPWIVNTTCPENVEHIEKTNFENYRKGDKIRGALKDLLGNGFFNADGHNWHSQRRIATRMFTASSFEEHIWAVVRRNAKKLRDMMECAADQKAVDVFSLMNRFTLDTMSEIGFGQCIGSLEDPSSPFLRSFDRVQRIVFSRFFNPFWRVCRSLGICSERETQEHLGCLDRYTRSVVRELCTAFEQDASKSTGVCWADLEARKSFVGLFLDDAQKRSEQLSEDFLRDLVLNFLISGRDTAAQALSWTIFCLCTHPEVERKARQEVIDVCGVRGPAFEDMPAMPYLQAVINETLRLYPPVPINCKTALCDDALPDGTHVARGTMVVYDIFSMGRDPNIWGEDADVFRPERWLAQDHQIGHFEYPVFNTGPRECLGRKMVEIEMKICLATLLPQVSFHLAVPAHEISADASMLIGMGHGLPCFVERVHESKRVSSNASATEDSTSVGDWTDTSSMADTTDASSSAAEDSAATSSEGKRRIRGKKRKSGWSRRRQLNHWRYLRESTPERWVDEIIDAGHSSTRQLSPARRLEPNAAPVGSVVREATPERWPVWQGSSFGNA